MSTFVSGRAGRSEGAVARLVEICRQDGATRSSPRDLFDRGEDAPARLGPIDSAARVPSSCASTRAVLSTPHERAPLWLSPGFRRRLHSSNTRGSSLPTRCGSTSTAHWRIAGNFPPRPSVLPPTTFFQRMSSAYVHRVGRGKHTARQTSACSLVRKPRLLSNYTGKPCVFLPHPDAALPLWRIGRHGITSRTEPSSSTQAHLGLALGLSATAGI